MAQLFGPGTLYTPPLNTAVTLGGVLQGPAASAAFSPAGIQAIELASANVYDVALIKYATSAMVIGGANFSYDQLLAAAAADAPFVAASISRWRFPSIALLQKFFPAVTNTTFAQANPQNVVVPSESSLWLEFPGSAGVVQFQGSNPGAQSILLSTGAPNNHGALYVSGLWAMGDPTLAVGTADSFTLLKMSVAWEIGVWDCRILGFLAASRVLDLEASKLHVRGLHMSRCGASAGATNALVYILGSEFGITVEDVDFLSTQPPPNVPAPAAKDNGLTPGIYRDQTGNVGAAGDRYVNVAGGDILSALIVVKPTAGGFVGPQTFVDIWPQQNCANGAAGAIQVSAAAGAVRGGVYVFGGDCTLNGAGQPAWAFASLACPITMHNVRVNQEALVFPFDFTGCTGPVFLNECSTDTAGQRVPVTGATTGLVKEVFKNIRGTYYINSGGTTANLAVSWTGTRQVQTSPLSTDPQAIAGVAATTVATGLLSPIQDPGQANVTITADATAGGIAVNALFKPSTTTVGTFAQVAAGNRASGAAQQAIAASGTGFAELS